MKRLISLLLCVVLVFSFCVPAFAAGYDEHPTIYVMGAQTSTTYSADGTPILTEGENAGEIIKEALLPCLEKLAVGLLVNDFEEYAKEFHAAFMQIYGGLALDKNGEVSDGSYPEHPYDYSLPKKSSNYNEYDYRFWYDWRISPIVVAADLKNYVDKVKGATGEDKVNIMGRCYGANVVQAYLALYPEHAKANVDDIAYLASSVDGIDMLGAIFAGEMQFEGDAVTNFVDYFMENGDLIEDEAAKSLITTLVEVLNYTKTLDISTDSLELLIGLIQQDLIPMILKDYYGSMPSYWSMIPVDKVEKAKAFIFKDCEEEYAGLIEKIDAYYNDVQLNVDETLTYLSKAGIDFYIVSKYNFPDYPLYEGATAQSDGNTTVVRQSFGATCADFGEVLSDDYIASLSDAKYLSPDHKIDASTCRFPETSYFIKDLHHETFPYAINRFGLDIMNKEATVSGGEYAQYLLYTDWYGAMKPVEGLDEDGTKTEEPSQLLFIRFFTAIINFMTKLLKGEISLGK